MLRPPVDSAVGTKRRLAGLDVLRLLAIMMVLGRHTSLPPDEWPTVLRGCFLAWQRGGWVGVDLFFVLSGFLVSGLLFAEYKSRGQFSVGRFYMRRGWKIYPPFILLIAVTVIVSLVRGFPVDKEPLASELLFLQSYIPGLWNHTWSLAVEEHFYLLLPLVLVLVLRWNVGSTTPLKPVLFLAAAVGACELGLRLLNWYYRPFSHLTHLFASHLRLDSLFFGVAISYAYHFHTRRFVELLTPWRECLIAGGTALLTLAFIFELETTPFIFTIGLTLFYLASGMVLVGVLLSPLPRTRFVALMAAIGAYSYSIYLWHMAVDRWGLPLLERAWGPLGFGVRTAAYVFGSLAVGIVMAKIVEVPVLRLRDRWFPPRAAGPIEELPEPIENPFGPRVLPMSPE